MEEQTVKSAEEYLCQVVEELKKLVGAVHRKFGLRWRDRNPSRGDTNEYLEMPAVPNLWTWCIQHVAVKVQTTAYTRLIIGTQQFEDFKVLEDTPAPAGGTWYTWDGEFFCHPGEVFKIWMIGTTSGEILEGNVTGWRQKIVSTPR